MRQSSATFLGFGAVLLWALLALFTVATAPVPPLQLNTVSFGIGGVAGLIWAFKTNTLGKLKEINWRVYLFGTLGLFGYHTLYFYALRMAPAADAGLIAYLWPLLIVLFSGMLPGEILRRGHVLGAVAGFLGAALIVAKGGNGFSQAALPGYAMAALAAVTWASYSVLSRRLPHVPTASVAVFCLATAALSLLAHLGLETTRWPTAASGWGALIALGLGPVGLAFYLWDIGVKHGDIQVLGAASYAAPLLSTLALIVAGYARAGSVLLIAALLIATGAALAARASAQKR